MVKDFKVTVNNENLMSSKLRMLSLYHNDIGFKTKKAIKGQLNIIITI